MSTGVLMLGRLRFRLAMGIGRALVVGRAAIASLLYAAETAWARPLTLPNLRTLATSFGEQVDDGNIHDDFLELFAATVAGFGVPT